MYGRRWETARTFGPHPTAALLLAGEIRQVQSDCVTESQELVGAQQHLDELRRRLYRADATEEDLRRYDEERAAVLAAQDRAPASSSDPMKRRRHRLLVGAAACAVALLAGTGVAVTARPLHPLVAPSAAPSTSNPLQDLGDTRALVPQGNVATRPPTQLVVGAGAPTAAQRYQGTGDAVVALDPSSASSDGRRIVVMLSSKESAQITWRAVRPTARTEWTSYHQVVAQGTVSSGPGVPPPIDFHYVGAPPSSIEIEAPAGVHWTLLVAFLTDSELGIR